MRLPADPALLADGDRWRLGAELTYPLAVCVLCALAAVQRAHERAAYARLRRKETSAATVAATALAARL